MTTKNVLFFIFVYIGKPANKRKECVGIIYIVRFIYIQYDLESIRNLIGEIFMTSRGQNIESRRVVRRKLVCDVARYFYVNR